MIDLCVPFDVREVKHPVMNNSFDIASCSPKCLFLREAKVELTKSMQNGKSFVLNEN